MYWALAVPIGIIGTIVYRRRKSNKYKETDNIWAITLKELLWTGRMRGKTLVFAYVFAALMIGMLAVLYYTVWE
jgi:hypothetical protein